MWPHTKIPPPGVFYEAVGKASKVVEQQPMESAEQSKSKSEFLQSEIE